MAGIYCTSQDPLKYVDAETDEKLEVRSLVDEETGKKICIVFDLEDNVSVAQIHGTSCKTKGWKRTLKFDENISGELASKPCDVTEKMRIKSVTNLVSATEII